MTDRPSAIRRALHSIGPLHRALSRHRGTLIHEPTHQVPQLARLGSYYGGWTVIPQLLNGVSVVYSVGVGDDLTFDHALKRRFGCTVHAFDPTPIAGQWVARQDLPPEIVFHPIGLAGEDGEVEFALPLHEGWDSFSLPSEGSREEVVKCPVRRLETIARDLGHSRIDLLKMDIEGFEYGVIDDVLAGPLRPKQWLIEFHHEMMHFTADQTRAAVAKLEAAGYKLFSVSNVGHEYSFVHSPSA